MMDDLINRQDAIKACFDIRVANNYDIADLIEMLPSAQKKDEWIKTGQSFVFSEKFRNYSCSECGYDVDKTKFNFCPNCGADMRGEKMSVLIKGIEIPKEPWDCPCHDGENGRCKVTKNSCYQIPKDCPLVEVPTEFHDKCMEIEIEKSTNMDDLISRQDAIKAYTASDRNGDTGFSIVVFAETAGKAKAYAANSDGFDEYDFTEIRVNRRKELDRFYKGKREMDWMNDEDRVAMVRYANFECSCEVVHPECERDQCPAQQWCGRYERMKDE